MIKISREWATPLTIGVFGLMTFTGLLMFFHLESSLQKVVHEWAGWLVVFAAVSHAAANWLGFKRYFKGMGMGAVILGMCGLAVAGSFMALPGGGGEPQSPPAIAMRAISQAPVKAVAPLFGKTSAQALKELGAAGITLPDEDASIGSVTGADRERMAHALRALARKQAP